LSERLITSAGVLIALVVIVGIFVQPSGEPPVGRPVSSEPGRNGYQGLARWLESEGIEAISSRERYHQIQQIAPPGSILLVTAPFERSARSDEIRSLLDWVESGNTLVVLAALTDTPDWSMSADETFVEDVENLTDIAFEAATDEKGEPRSTGDLLNETSVTLTPERQGHPLTRDISEVTGRSDTLASIWVPAEHSNSPGTPFLQESTTGVDAAWTNAWGRGHIITITVGSLFTNRVLGETDNGLLFANLIRWHLKGEGKVVFDDLHQGLSNLYDPEAFYSDSRLGITILFILLFWFTYMIGTQNRMVPIRNAESVPEQGEFVRAMGGFLARKLEPNDTARLIFDRWFSELDDRRVTRRGSSPWTYLSDSPLVDEQDLAELRRLDRQIDSGEKVDLSRLHNSIQRIREALG